MPEPETLESIEEYRLERIKLEASNFGAAPEQFIGNAGPDTYGCHEALHTAMICMNLVDTELCGHPAVLAKPEWFALAQRAFDNLYNLYQAIGAAHMTDNAAPKPHDGI